MSGRRSSGPADTATTVSAVVTDTAQRLLDDYLTADAITFVEWPGRLAEPWENVAARVTISHAGGDERLVSIEA